MKTDPTAGLTWEDLAAWHEREAADKFRLADRLSEMGDEKAACQLAVSADWHRAAAALIASASGGVSDPALQP